jgi:hypothetical protein
LAVNEDIVPLGVEFYTFAALYILFAAGDNTTSPSSQILLQCFVIIRFDLAEG